MGSNSRISEEEGVMNHICGKVGENVMADCDEV